MLGGEMFVFWRKSKESIIAPLIDEPQVFMGQHHATCTTAAQQSCDVTYAQY